MGEPWRRHRSWEVVDRAEAALNQSLSHLLLEPSGAGLQRTRDAQLAVLLSSLLAWEALRERIETPVAFAGHSLGQVTALVAAGALSLEDGVRLALRRADCTQAAADHRPGRMVALLGASLDQARQACGGGRSECWVANDNAPGQVVLGGTPAGIEAASERARKLGVRRIKPLNVAAAFHTPLMAEAADELALDLDVTRFARPEAPVVCNVDASAHGDDAWAAPLALHLVTTVRWRESVLSLHDLGVDRFYEVGPGNVLAGLVRRTFGGLDVADIVTTGITVPDDLPEPLSVAGASSGRMV